jgi:hypothetical protein
MDYRTCRLVWLALVFLKYDFKVASSLTCLHPSPQDLISRFSKIAFRALTVKKKSDIRPIYPKEFGTLLAQSMKSFEILSESIKETLRKKTEAEISKDIQEAPTTPVAHTLHAFGRDRLLR